MRNHVPPLFTAPAPAVDTVRDAAAVLGPRLSPRHWSRLTAFGMSALLALGSAACSDDKDDTKTTTDTAVADTAVVDTASGDTATAGDDVTTVQTTCTESAPGCIEQSRYVADLTAIAVPRHHGTAGWKAAQELCAKRLGELGYTVTLEPYATGTNVIGRKLGTKAADEWVVLGAHTDSMPDCPGADDNATGVAGVLEAARALAASPHERSLLVACFDEEERGLFGSEALAIQLARAKTKVALMASFEMIGFTSSEPNSQTLPAGFDAIFTAQAQEVASNENRGDFLAIIRNSTADGAVAAAMARAKVDGLHAVDIAIPKGMELAEIMSTLGRSDHAPYWYAGYPALMLSDTAEFRNKAYHCKEGSDTVDRLDHVFATRIIRTAVAMAEAALKADATPALAPVAPTCTAKGKDAASSGCDAGQKCALRWPGSASVAAATCLPLEASVATAGELCQRPKNVAGEDTCGAGLFCSFWGEPASSPQTRRCRTVCESHGDCVPSDACVRLATSLHTSGMCLQRCELDDVASCGEGRTCVMRYDLDNKPTAICDRIGKTAVGGSCKFDDDCVGGALCTHGGAGSGLACRPTCGPKRACEGGASCELFQGTQVGVCTATPSLSLSAGAK